ncbi:insulin-like growth factor-binding protein complex acid labile subunit [Ischnura elegans]|uniref:insulin-like growth factor-binding protein complex acid labile subunit n=1 Tax=Ischnura elegans TaxID=197161 RepID=UPI001ED883F4|nr:insulin-like growth factor-binding protein complex acid labile subunit [Ischnura elegans]
MGYHCIHEPKCIRLRRDEFFCEDKVLIRRFMVNMQQEKQVYTRVYYTMECMEETEEDPYNYLSLILSTNFSVPFYRYSNNSTDGELRVTDCSIPSSNLSVLFGGESAGFFGRRDIILEILTVDCKDEETHFSMNHWSGLETLKKLYIICPKLSKVDNDLFSGVSKRLEHLQFTDTEIQYLPKRFFSNMEVMETLDLRRNKLRSFRSSYLRSMWNLKKLYLSENEIDSLDDDIFFQTKQLTHLKLESNSLTALPTSVCSLRNLQNLNAGYNRISFIPKDCLRSLPSLFSIYLNGNRLFTFGLASESILPNYNNELSSFETLPNSSTTLEQSRNLKNTWIGGRGVWDLLLDNNSLSSLPDEAFYGMVKLKVLKISSNKISHFPENIFSRNKNLYHLLASNNLFTHIPARLLKNNTRLRTLDLSHNLIETLHEDFFSNSIKLCHIDISDNRIHHLPDKIFKPFKSQKPECLEFVLDMSRNRLKDVPELSIPELTHLDLSGNHLTLFKTEILLQPSRLQELNLSHNLLHTIENSDGPVEIKYPFGKLEVIDLSSNQLTELPTFGFKLATLKHLNVSSNNFKEPLSITMSLCHAYFHSLETLDMSRSRLKGMVLRYDYITVEKLKHMDLSHNFIDLEDCIEAVDARRLVWGCVSPLYSFTALELLPILTASVIFSLLLPLLFSPSTVPSSAVVKIPFPLNP